MRRARVSEQGLAIQEQVIKAADVVYGTVQCTRLEHCAWLSGTEHGQVLLKLESAQVGLREYDSRCLLYGQSSPVRKLLLASQSQSVLR